MINKLYQLSQISGNDSLETLLDNIDSATTNKELKQALKSSEYDVNYSEYASYISNKDSFEQNLHDVLSVLYRSQLEFITFNMVSDSMENNGENEEIQEEIKNQTNEQLEMFLIEGGYFETN